MFQLLTGELPFGKLEDPNDLVIYQRNGKNNQWNRSLLQHSEKGRKWEMVIERCLIPDFRQRLQSARAVLERLPASAKSIPPLPAYRHSNGVLCLRVMQGMDYGQVFRLKDLLQGTKRIITIGRDRGNSLCLRDGEYPRLSRRHCTLETDLQGRWFVRDGQWVTEQRVDIGKHLLMGLISIPYRCMPMDTNYNREISLHWGISPCE